MKRTALAIPVLLFTVLIIHVPFSAAADITVNLQLDRKESIREDFIKMVVRISGTRKGKLQPVIKGTEHFTVTSGGTSSRMEIINGQINSGIDYTYFIQPKKTGTFTIGPAEITVKGKTYRSNQVKLKVLSSIASPKGEQEPLFLIASLSSQTAYVEEQIIYTLKLYRLYKVSDLSLNLPAMPHFTLKQLGEPLEYQGVHDGRSYQVLEVRYSLVSSRAGNYEIDPSRMNMTVFQKRRRSSRGLFDDPFFSFSRGQPVTIASNSPGLKVLPLPEEGRPTDFSGLVGTFRIDSQLEPSAVKAGESATLTVHLRGKGNVNRIPDLKIPKTEQIKVYADEPVLTINQDEEGISGLKTMKWALVPETGGEFQIPSLAVNFFDTKNHRYREEKTPSHLLSVSADEKKPVEILADPNREGNREGSLKQTVEELGRDILPVHTSIKELSDRPRWQSGGPVFWVILLFPLSLYSLTFGGIKLAGKTERSATAQRAKRAAKKFIRNLRSETLDYNDLTELIRGYINDRFDLSLGSLTPEETAEILRSRGVGPDTAKKIEESLREIEDIIYTGKGHESFGGGKDLPKLVKKIEKEIR